METVGSQEHRQKLNSYRVGFVVVVELDVEAVIVRLEELEPFVVVGAEREE